MRISPEQISPSQDFLKPDTVAFIFDCIEKGEHDRLPPAPIVRQDEKGRFIAIDGHNLIAVRLYRQEGVEVHLARSVADGLLATTTANIQRNSDLYEKFNSVIAERDRLVAEGITNFQGLLDRYPELFP